MNTQIILETQNIIIVDDWMTYITYIIIITLSVQILANTRRFWSEITKLSDRQIHLFFIHRQIKCSPNLYFSIYRQIKCTPNLLFNFRQI